MGSICQFVMNLQNLSECFLSIEFWVFYLLTQFTYNLKFTQTNHLSDQTLFCLQSH